MTRVEKCYGCGRTFFPNELEQRELFGVILNACKKCRVGMDDQIHRKIRECALKSLPHGQQQRIKRERAAEYAGSDFDMVDA